MLKKLERFEPQILGITRILVGILMICHGSQKVFDHLRGAEAAQPSRERAAAH